MLLCASLAAGSLESLLADFGLTVLRVKSGSAIPGTYWGEPEAGLVGQRLFIRDDTPVHSALHEGCHYICMDDDRRRGLHTDAGGAFIEEDAVCYLQIILGSQLPGCSIAQMQADMDAWGYHFRLGSAAAWFEHDAGDALAWLQQKADHSHDAGSAQLAATLNTFCGPPAAVCC